MRLCGQSHTQRNHTCFTPPHSPSVTPTKLVRGALIVVKLGMKTGFKPMKRPRDATSLASRLRRGMARRTCEQQSINSKLLGVKGGSMHEGVYLWQHSNSGGGAISKDIITEPLVANRHVSRQ